MRPRPQGPIRVTPDPPAAIALGAMFDVRLRQQFNQPAQEPSDRQIAAIRQLATEALHIPPAVPINDACSDTTPRNTGAWRGDPELYPEAMRCPITCEPFRDPVVAADGHSYERSAIAEWLRKRETSPVTNCRLPHPLVMPNHTLRAAVDAHAAAAATREAYEAHEAHGRAPTPPPTPDLAV